jgi:hypothetical protein
LKLLFMRAATRAIKPVLRRHGDVGKHTGGNFMTRKSMVRSFLLSTVAPAVIAAASMATTSPALAQCARPGTPPLVRAIRYDGIRQWAPC